MAKVKLTDLMKEKQLLSFELFPPKTDKGMENLPGTIEKLCEFKPEYISCTYGAGGGNVGRNREVCQEIIKAGTVPVTHFTVIKNTKEGIKQQLEQFHQVLDTIHSAGFETGVVHAAGSFSLLHDDSARLDGVRAGSAILGRCRRTRDDGLRTVGYGEAPLAEVRWLPRGHTIGADKPLVLKKPTRVAVLPVGYQNGFGVERPRQSGLTALLAQWRRSRRRTVRVGEQRARVLGPVGASETILDVTNMKCAYGDLAVFEMDPLFARGFVIEYR